jgi:hypothetical protein
MKRHRRTCPAWQGRDKNAVQQARTEAAFTEKYGEGVTNARHVAEAEERRKATVQERYGAENVFSKDSTLFNQVQASLEGKRPVLKGEDNPFAQPDVQEKIRQHWQREYGVGNPQQVPEIRAQTKATNLERYGGEMLGSPELAAKVRATNKARYGDEFPQRTDEVKTRIIETNEARYGVPWTSMDPEVRTKQLATMEAKYGSHFFASEEGKGIVRAAMLEKYGVEFWMQTEGAWDKLVETFRERFGVDHPLQDPEILARARQTCIDRYGTPFPGLMNKGPNKLEQRVWDKAPQLMFTGDGSFWRWLPALDAYKNPDFLLPGPDPEHPFRGVTKVIEVFGDYWHGRMRTGKAGFEHEQELVDAFADIGFECLVVWESHVKNDPDEVGGRLRAFLG